MLFTRCTLEANAPVGRMVFNAHTWRLTGPKINSLEVTARGHVAGCGQWPFGGPVRLAFDFCSISRFVMRTRPSN
jgi:hypothetical protein